MEQYQNNSVPPQQHYAPSQPLAPIMTMGQWLITMILMIIPLVNIILLIVWAVSSSENPNRSNWAKAQLIFFIIGIVIWVVFAGAIIGAMGGLSSI